MSTRLPHHKALLCCWSRVVYITRKSNRPTESGQVDCESVRPTESPESHWNPEEPREVNSFNDRPLERQTVRTRLKMTYRLSASHPPIIAATGRTPSRPRLTLVIGRSLRPPGLQQLAILWREVRGKLLSKVVTGDTRRWGCGLLLPWSNSDNVMFAMSGCCCIFHDNCTFIYALISLIIVPIVTIVWSMSTLLVNTIAIY